MLGTLLPDFRDSVSTPKWPATFFSNHLRFIPLFLSRDLLSHSSSDSLNTRSTNSDPPRIRSSALTLSPESRSSFSPFQPPTERSNPPPTNSGLLSSPSPSETYDTYSLLASLSVCPKYRRP